MDTINKAVFYLFVLAFLLVAVAYWAGTTGILSTIFAGVNSVGNTYTGRNPAGVFAAYPTTPA